MVGQWVRAWEGSKCWVAVVVSSLSLHTHTHTLALKELWKIEVPYILIIPCPIGIAVTEQLSRKFQHRLTSLWASWHSQVFVRNQLAKVLSNVMEDIPVAFYLDVVYRRAASSYWPISMYLVLSSLALKLWTRTAFMMSASNPFQEQEKDPNDFQKAGKHKLCKCKIKLCTLKHYLLQP